MAAFITAAQARALATAPAAGIKLYLSEAITAAANAKLTTLSLPVADVLAAITGVATPAQAQAYLVNLGYSVSVTNGTVTIAW